MKKTLISLLCCMAMAACSNSNTQTAENNTSSQNQEPQVSEVKAVQNVEGRTNFGAKEPIMTPMPCIMIATWDENKNPDVMMAAWGSQCDYDKIAFALSPHKTTDNIRLKKAFTISFADAKTLAQSDYFGIVSGNDVPDKVARAGFTITPSPNVDAPIVNEYPLTLECEAVVIEEDGNGGARVVGKVVNWSADDSILTDGKVDINKLQPVIYNSADLNYYIVGDSVGQAWNTGKVFQ